VQDIPTAITAFWRGQTPGEKWASRIHRLRLPGARPHVSTTSGPARSAIFCAASSSHRTWRQVAIYFDEVAGARHSKQHRRTAARKAPDLKLIDHGAHRGCLKGPRGNDVRRETRRTGAVALPSRISRTINEVSGSLQVGGDYMPGWQIRARIPPASFNLPIESTAVLGLRAVAYYDHQGGLRRQRAAGG